MSLLTHAIQVLNCFDEQQHELRLSDISRQVGISTSHAHRLLSVMVEEGLLRRGPYSPRYRLGLRLFELGRLAVADLDPPLVIPGMQELSEKTGETVLLALRDRADVVFLQRVDSPQVLRVSPPAPSALSGLDGGRPVDTGVGDRSGDCLRRANPVHQSRRNSEEGRAVPS